MKAKNGLYNVGFSALGQIITIVMGLVIPRLFVVSFGSEVNGMILTINQIFACFVILEAGIGVTTVQALYKPITANDKNSINGILSATNKYYKKIAVIYFVALLIFASVFYFCIQTTQDYLFVFLIILFTGLSNVINFTFQEKYKLILEAEGKKYITINTQTIILVLVNASKIALILLGFNVIVIQFVFFIINLLQVFIICLYIKKKYKWIDLSVKPNYAAISQKNSVMVHQFSGLIFSNVDVILLTVICGLEVSSIYGMYKLIFNLVSTFLSNISSGLSFLFGHTFATDKNKYIQMLDVYDTYYQAIGFGVYTIAFVFILPFMRLYTAGLDINYIDPLLPFLFVSIEALNVVRNSSLTTINVSGHFKKTQWRSLFEAVINIVCSLIFVFSFGIYGVLLGTIIALLYRSNDIIIYGNKVILERSPKKTYFIALTNILLMGIFMFIFINNPINVNSYLSFALSAIPIGFVILLLFLIYNSLLNRAQFFIIFNQLKNKFFKKRKAK